MDGAPRGAGGIPVSEPPLPGQKDVPFDPERRPEEAEGRIGIFPSWGWLYGTVIAWTVVVILLLYAFTITFDYGAR